MARSFISLVDNARELQASIAADEATEWTCVYDKESSKDWQEYYYTNMAGDIYVYTKAVLSVCAIICQPAGRSSRSGWL
jgi:hypothetical protein